MKHFNEGIGKYLSDNTLSSIGFGVSILRDNYSRSTLKLNGTVEEEYELIQQKKSKLSAKERRAVVEEYLKLKNKTEREIYNEPN